MNNYRDLVNRLESIDKKYTLIAEGVTLPEISTALKGYEYDENVRFSILANIAKKNSLPGLFDPVSGKYINNEGEVDDVDNEVTKQLSALGLVPDNASLEQAGWFDNQEVRDKANAAIKGMSGQVAAKQVSDAESQVKLKQLGDLLAKYVDIQSKMAPRAPMMESISHQLVESFGYSVYEDNTLGSQAATTGAGYAGGKLASKMLGKALPGVGLAYGAKDAYDRFQKGDYVGAGLAGASGIASLIPGIGTAAALGLDAANIGRDMYNDDEQAAHAAQSTPAKPADTRSGMKHSGTSEVYDLQKSLVAKGAKIATDGILGPKTIQAIKDFGAPTVAESIRLVQQRLDDIANTTQVDEGALDLLAKGAKGLGSMAKNAIGGMKGKGVSTPPGAFGPKTPTNAELAANKVGTVIGKNPKTSSALAGLGAGYGLGSAGNEPVAQGTTPATSSSGAAHNRTGQGSTGTAKRYDPAVAKIQQELVAKNHQLKVDGIMGPKTRAAMEWEKTNANTDRLASEDNKALADLQGQINKLIGELSSSTSPDVQQLLKQATDTISSGPGAANMQPAMNALKNVASGLGAAPNANLDASTQAGLDQQLAALAKGQADNDAAMSPERREMERRKSLDKWDTIAYGKPTGVY